LLAAIITPLVALTTAATIKNKMEQKEAEKLLKNEGYFCVDLQDHFSKITKVLKVLRTMERKNLECIAPLNYGWDDAHMELSFLNQLQNPELREAYEIGIDDNLIKFRNKTTNKEIYFILGHEVGINCRGKDQEFHLLSIGVDSEKIKHRECLEDSLDDIWAHDGMPILDHAFSDPQHNFRDVQPGSEKGKEIEEILRKYKENLPAEWNAYCLPDVRNAMRFFGLGDYGDSNKKLEMLAEKLKQEGIQIRIVPTSDIHFVTQNADEELGKAFIAIPSTDINTTSCKKFVNSIYDAIKSGNYEPSRQYVSLFHFIPNWGLPKISYYLGGEKKK